MRSVNLPGTCVETAESTTSRDGGIMVTFMSNRGFRYEAGGCSVTGGRSSNQDSFGSFHLEGSSDLCAGDPLFVIADGMGGHTGGDRASKMAVRELHGILHEQRGKLDVIDDVALLRDAFLEVDRRMQELGADDPRFSEMGTTLTAVWARRDHLVYAHAGDSRLYRWRPDGFEQLTEDQNVAYRLWREGRLTEEEYLESPYRCALLSYVGGGKIEVEVGSYGLSSSERLLLATDGLVEATETGDLEEHLASAEDPESCASKLVRLAEVRGARDNVTALAVWIEPK